MPVEQWQVDLIMSLFAAGLLYAILAKLFEHLVRFFR
jgi:hypothetical protein